MSHPTIGLAIIARNEEHNLPQLLESITGAFDQVALVDTGSTDDTIAIAEGWAHLHGENLTVDHFDWVDDFAAARNHAQNLLTTDWTCWADADDTIVGADHLHDIVATAPAGWAAYGFPHDIVIDGEPITWIRERLVKHGHGLWVGRVHEQQWIDGPRGIAHDPRIRWIHGPWTSEDLKAAEERDKRIAARYPDATAHLSASLHASIATGNAILDALLDPEAP